MLSSLLQGIKQMNENIQALSEPIVPSGDEADDLDEVEEPDAGNVEFAPTPITLRNRGLRTLAVQQT